MTPPPDPWWQRETPWWLDALALAAAFLAINLMAFGLSFPGG